MDTECKTLPLQKRRMKVYYGNISNPDRLPLPMIRLQGRYLQTSGYTIGSHIEVEIGAEQITIRKIFDHESSG